MIYIIGGNYQMALEYGRRLGVHPGMRVVHFYSATTLAHGPGLRGHEFHPGDTVYTSGLKYASARELSVINEQIDMCVLRCDMRVSIDPDRDVTIYEILSPEDAAAGRELEEIEKLRQKILEDQQRG